MARVEVKTYTAMWGETTWESEFSEFVDSGLLYNELRNALSGAARDIFKQYESKEDK